MKLLIFSIFLHIIYMQSLLEFCDRETRCFSGDALSGTAPIFRSYAFQGLDALSFLFSILNACSIDLSLSFAPRTQTSQWQFSACCTGELHSDKSLQLHRVASEMLIFLCFYEVCKLKKMVKRCVWDRCNTNTVKIGARSDPIAIKNKA